MGCGVLRVALQAHPPGGFGKAALRHYERTRGARRATIRNVNTRAVPDANKPPQWSAERRASPGARTAVPICAGTRGPSLVRTQKGASQAPERLSALRSLTS